MGFFPFIFKSPLVIFDSENAYLSLDKFAVILKKNIKLP